MIKKTLIFVLFLMCIINVSYGTTYLNSCGKSSGWTNGETYLINFTEIPAVYATGYCFKFNVLANSNMIFRQVTPLIEIKTSVAQLDMFEGFGNNYIMEFSTFEDFNIIDTTATGTVNFLEWGKTGGTGAIFRNNTLQNMTLKNFGHLYYSTDRGQYRDNLVDDIFFFGDRLQHGLINPANMFYNNRFESSAIIVNDLEESGAAVINFNFYYNSVITDRNSAVLSNIGATTNFSNCVVKGFPHVDSDNDNVADSDLYAYHTLGRIYRTVKDVRYIQDVNEGLHFVVGSTTITQVEDEIIGSPLILSTQTGTIVSSEFNTYLFSNFNGIILNSNSQYKNIFGLSDTLLQDNIASVFTLGTPYKGLIRLSGSNLIISDLNFNKLSSNNNAHIISEFIGVTRNNITIQDNNLYKADDNFKYLNNYFIKIYGNNIDMNNNLFNMSTAFNNAYEVLDIQSINPTTNNVYENEFYFTGASATTPTLIFTDNHGTNFYNNYVGNKINITNEVTYTGLNVTPYKGFLYTDNKIYYYYVGNYYVDNTGCADGDGDGFCDSSYTSGTVIDVHPLASYPFDFTAHLLTADIIVDDADFNITLNYPTNNLSIEVVDTNGIIQFNFEQNSDFIDLICTYYIDGADIETELSPLKDTEYIINVTGWTEKSYTFYVNCYNEYRDITSSEYTFIVTFAEGEGVGEDGGEGGGEPITGGSFSGIIDTTDPEGTVDNTISFFSNIGDFILYIFAPMAILIIIIIIAFAVVNVLR